MRNGNTGEPVPTHIPGFVLILPMRNGNTKPSNTICQRLPVGSYPTYEEWKLTSGSLAGWVKINVLILPMRNGNLNLAQYSYSISQFLSYLWGMETTDFVSFQNFIPKFLSYLWGMETFFFSKTKKTIISSYPTYEEWKPSFISSLSLFILVLILPMRNGNIFYCTW